MNRYVTQCAVALLLVMSASGAPTQEGLIAHYTFDEGDIVRDVSGNGHDGQIRGATFVPSPRGHALHFDGEDDHVVCPGREALNVAGDLTIEVWLRAERIDQRNRMIVGDAAGLTINRNYNLRIDRGQLRFEYADGESHGVILHDADFLEDNDWHHIALICEYPRFFLYIDGEQARTGGLAQPITPTPGAARMIGGWFAGHFQGDIDDVRLYDRALPESSVVAHATGDDRPPPSIHLYPELHYSRGQVLLGAVVNCREQPAAVELSIMRGTETLRTETVRAEPSREGSERWAAQARLPTEGIEPGMYAMQALADDQRGRRIVETRVPWEFPERPVWLESRAGISDEVLPPFTELTIQQTDAAVVIRPWGRKYRLGAEPFPTQIESSGAELLAGPIRLIARSGEGTLSWKPAAHEVKSRSRSRIEMLGRFEGEGAALLVRTTIGYDGFVKLDWRLTGKETAAIDELTFEIPLKREHAKYLYTWPKVRSGTLNEAYSSSFQPIVWLGDEERGLQWLCESDRNWSLEDPGKAIQVLPDDERVVFRLNLFDRETELQPGDELSYTFALQATPVKPIAKSVWDYRIFRNPWYGYSLDILDKEVDGKPALRHFADKGGRAMLVLRWWDAFAYTDPQSHADAFRRLVEACHAEGIQVVPYIGGFLLSEETPEGRFFMAEMEKRPVTHYPINRLPGLESQMTRIVCQRGPWQDFLVDGIARLIDEYDVDGVYLDSTTLPWPCTNELHDCGYGDGGGRRRPRYPVFAVREMLERIYTVVKQRKPDGIVDVHTYDCMHAGALGFATCYWNGEQLERGPKIKAKGLPLDRFRTEFMGYNWGVPADLLYYVLGGYRQCMAIALLHDVPVRAENLRDFETQSTLWSVREQFGCDEAEFLPYWRNADYVTVTGAECYVSLHRHPAGRALAVVSNLGEQAQDVELALNREKLGLTDELSARDAMTGAAISVEGNRIALALPGQDWRVIRVEAESP